MNIKDNKLSRCESSLQETQEKREEPIKQENKSKKRLEHKNRIVKMEKQVENERYEDDNEAMGSMPLKGGPYG